MTPQEPDDDRDALSGLLRRWTAPVVPEGMDESVLAAFRKQTRPAPWWSPFLATSVRVPIPVALAVMLALLVTTALAFRRPPAAAEIPPAVPEATQSARTGEPPMVTSTSLAGFRPVDEVTATVVAEAKAVRP
jgi:hypothetical protein